MPNKNTFITVTDQFCGAGGSSIGAAKAGAEIKLAMNHWKLAIETHNTNFPNVDHDCADISAVNPRRYPSTDILITSPECTNHSLAKGKPRRYYTQDLFGNILLDPAEERSRATMWDVPRFAEYHDYRIIIVENVVDAGKWRLFDSWIHAMHALGYDHEIVYFNSQFAWPTPQSRDRMYTVFWKQGNPKPNLDFRPLAWCSHCQKDTQSVQSWKKRTHWGRYQRQYVYRCPTCRSEVEPYYYAAFNAIDWTIQAERIGDRKIPLRPKTMARIKYGLEKYGRNPVIISTRYTTGIESRVKPAAEFPMPTQPGDVSQAIVFPWLVETNPMWRKTTCQDVGLVAPAFIAEMHGTSKAAPITDPLMCMTSTGSHHALLNADVFMTYYYGTQQASGINEPIHTMTGIDRAGLVGALSKLTIDDLTFRMLRSHEIGKAMAFPGSYIVLGTQREKVKQYGNAVTPPVMEMILNRCMEVLQ